MYSPIPLILVFMYLSIVFYLSALIRYSAYEYIICINMQDVIEILLN